MKSCIICNKELTVKQLKYCSGACKQKAHYNKFFKKNTNTSYSQFKRADIRKKLFIEELGGKCTKCGYCKNYAALHFHHLSDKKLSLDSRIIGNSSIKRIREELEKCTLLCANCHAEEHYPQCHLD
jgi:5-methylcytosine-specific restriction endonuclease McrA